MKTSFWLRNEKITKYPDQYKYPKMNEQFKKHFQVTVSRFGFRTNLTISILISALFLMTSNLSYSQKRLSLSAGMSYKWSYNQNKLENEGEDDAVSEADNGYFVSVGIFYTKDPDIAGFCRITYERYNSSLQNWERLPIGNMTANVIRIDPISFQKRFKESKLLGTFSLAGVNYITGRSKLLPDSYCYDEESSSWLLINEMEVNNTIGWSLFGFGLEYEITPSIALSVESVLFEEERVNIDFTTRWKKINSDVTSVSNMLPVKLRLIIKI